MPLVKSAELDIFSRSVVDVKAPPESEKFPLTEIGLSPPVNVPPIIWARPNVIVLVPWLNVPALNVNVPEEMKLFSVPPKVPPALFR
ncbi:MAG: hypothetical protein KCHDKBKB_01278 [Elusimicrobia bacterium]|nr:hypothetical protein [Elusimicrobiota bacterium]